MMQILLASSLLLPTAAFRAASVYAQEPQMEACRAWNQWEHDVREGKAEAHAARAAFRKLWPLVRLNEVPPPAAGRWQWVFPLPGYGFKDVAKKSYRGKGYSYYDGPHRLGHPGLDILVHDKDHDCLDDRNRKPIPVVAAMDGLVVATQPTWSPQDGNPEGVYVCILDQEDGRFFVYARLGRLKVALGQVVAKGQVIGWVGRTGADVNHGPMRTHLHFQVHDFADGRFYTLNPLQGLRVSRSLAWPLQEPDYSKPCKARPRPLTRTAH
jgi:murein DD-endopeptidase MepM/ murein hydrolase activator NlpD